VVDHIPQNLADGGSHFWLASLGTSESFFYFAHLLRPITKTSSFSLLNRRIGDYNAGKRATAGEVRPNPA
jgi:hypothetical protein